MSHVQRPGAKEGFSVKHSEGSGRTRNFWEQPTKLGYWLSGAFYILLGAVEDTVFHNWDYSLNII